MKGYKVKATGSYFSGQDKYDYEVEGTIPFMPEEWAEAAVRTRYAHMWIAQNPKYKERITAVRECFVEGLDVVEDAKFSFVDKDIREMDYGELQDLASLKSLLEVPLYRKESLPSSRMKAYVAYYNKCVRDIGEDELDHKVAGFKLSDQEPLTAKYEWRDAVEEEAHREDVLQNSFNNKRTLSMEDLKSLAKQRNIKTKANVTYEALYEKVFGATA